MFMGVKIAGFMENTQEKLHGEGKTQNGQTTKVWVSPPLELSCSYFFVLFSLDEKKFIVVQGV